MLQCVKYLGTSGALLLFAITNWSKYVEMTWLPKLNVFIFLPRKCIHTYTLQNTCTCKKTVTKFPKFRMLDPCFEGGSTSTSRKQNKEWKSNKSAQAFHIKETPINYCGNQIRTLLYKVTPLGQMGERGKKIPKSTFLKLIKGI